MNIIYIDRAFGFAMFCIWVYMLVFHMGAAYPHSLTLVAVKLVEYFTLNSHSSQRQSSQAGIVRKACM
jgi:hypothetical protein